MYPCPFAYFLISFTHYQFRCKVLQPKTTLCPMLQRAFAVQQPIPLFPPVKTMFKLFSLYIVRANELFSIVGQKINKRELTQQNIDIDQIQNHSVFTFLQQFKFLLISKHTWMQHSQHQTISQDKKLTLENFRQEIDRIKKPHLSQVKDTTETFHSRLVQFQKNIKKNDETQSEKQISRNQFENSKQQLSSERVSSSSQTNQIKQLEQCKKKLLTQSESDVLEIPRNHLKEWKPSDIQRFSDFEDAQKKYQDIFEKKLPAKKPTYNASQDYKKQENDMLCRIFDEIKDKNNPNSVSIKAVIEFFETYQLFYSFYNIRADDIENVLKEAARTFSTRLTKQQFINLLLHERPIVIGCHKVIHKELQTECILDTQSWKDLKAIFDTLDTFGNQTINIFGFFHRVKTNPSCRGLLDMEAVEFPEIGRRYTLRKVIFNFQKKYEHKNKSIKWQEIDHFIRNFSHKEQPSIDYIFDQQIKTADISRDTNYFLLDQKIIETIKNIFRRCPKYCQNFVKVKFLAEELFQSSYLKQNRSATVRIFPDESSKDQCTNLLQAIKRMLRSQFEYLDLDEVLEYFSIKGPRQNDFKIQFDKIFEEESSDQEDIQQQKQRRKMKKMKSLEMLKKPQVRRNPGQKFKKVVYDLTSPVQFKLYKREKPTIRQIKVQRMIQENYDKETDELNNKFKANPIPASINPQRYKAYMKMMQKRKNLIFEQLNKQGEKQKKILEYLESNTRLFDQKKQQPNPFQFSAKNTFESKPLPWFVKRDMLQAIMQEKQARRRLIFEQTKEKYDEYWECLVYDGQPQTGQNQSQQSLSQLLKQKKQNKQVQNPQPQIAIKAKPVPDFKQLQKKFAQDLKNKKQQYKPTIPKQFNLTSPKSKPIFGQEEAKQHLKTIQTRKSPTSTKYRSLSPPPTIASTQKYHAMVEFNQNKLRQQMLKKEFQQLEKKQRETKRRNFAKYMMKSFKKCSKNNTVVLKEKTKEKINKFKKQQQYLTKMNDQQLGKMYARVLQRPFLFQGSPNDKENEDYEYQPNQNQFTIPSQKGKGKINHRLAESSFPELPKELIPNQNGEIESEGEGKEENQQAGINFDMDQAVNGQRYYDFQGIANQSF